MRTLARTTDIGLVGQGPDECPCPYVCASCGDRCCFEKRLVALVSVGPPDEGMLWTDLPCVPQGCEADPF